MSLCVTIICTNTCTWNEKLPLSCLQIDQIESTSKQLSTAVLQDSTDRLILKSKLLSHQFNCYQTSLPSTYLLLVNVLKLVTQTGQLRYITLDIDQVQLLHTYDLLNSGSTKFVVRNFLRKLVWNLNENTLKIKNRNNCVDRF